MGFEDYIMDIRRALVKAMLQNRVRSAGYRDSIPMPVC